MTLNPDEAALRQLADENDPVLKEVFAKLRLVKFLAKNDHPFWECVRTCMSFLSEPLAVMVDTVKCRHDLAVQQALMQDASECAPRDSNYHGSRYTPGLPHHQNLLLPPGPESPGDTPVSSQTCESALWSNMGANNNIVSSLQPVSNRPQETGKPKKFLNAIGRNTYNARPTDAWQYKPPGDSHVAQEKKFMQREPFSEKEERVRNFRGVIEPEVSTGVSASLDERIIAIAGPPENPSSSEVHESINESKGGDNVDWECDSNSSSGADITEAAKDVDGKKFCQTPFIHSNEDKTKEVHWDSDGGQPSVSGDAKLRANTDTPEVPPISTSRSFENRAEDMELNQPKSVWGPSQGRSFEDTKRQGGADFGRGPRKCCRCPEEGPHEAAQHYRLFFVRLPEGTTSQDIEGCLPVRAEKTIVYKSEKNGFTLFATLQDAFTAMKTLNMIDGYRAIFCKDCEKVLRDLNQWDENENNKDGSQGERGVGYEPKKLWGRNDRAEGRNGNDGLTRGPRKCCRCPEGEPHQPEQHYRIFFAKLPPDTLSQDIEACLSVRAEKVFVFKSGRNGLEDAFSARDSLNQIDGYYVVFCKDCEEVLKDLNKWEDSKQGNPESPNQQGRFQQGFNSGQRAPSPPCGRSRNFRNDNDGEDRKPGFAWSSNFSSGSRGRFGNRRDSNNSNDGVFGVTSGGNNSRKCCGYSSTGTRCPDGQAHDPKEHYEIFFVKLPPDTQVQDIESHMSIRPEKTVVYRSGKHGFARFNRLDEALKAKDELCSVNGFFAAFCRTCENILKDLNEWVDKEEKVHRFENSKGSGNSDYQRESSPKFSISNSSAFERVLPGFTDGERPGLGKRKANDADNNNNSEGPYPKVQKVNEGGKDDGWESGE